MRTEEIYGDRAYDQAKCRKKSCAKGIGHHRSLRPAHGSRLDNVRWGIGASLADATG